MEIDYILGFAVLAVVVATWLVIKLAGNREKINISVVNANSGYLSCNIFNEGEPVIITNAELIFIYQNIKDKNITYQQSIITTDSDWRRILPIALMAKDQKRIYFTSNHPVFKSSEGSGIIKVTTSNSNVFELNVPVEQMDIMRSTNLT